MKIWWKFSKFLKISKNERKLEGRRSCSTSYPSGNQVDGSPLVAIRKQWLSRADLGPHKMVNQCKILSSYQCFARSPGEKCTGFVVKRIMKINIDVVRAQWGNEKPMFYRSSNFSRESYFQEIFGILENEEKKTNRMNRVC